MQNQLKVALITGAAKRIGAAIVRQLHQHGWNVIIHYRTSEKMAKSLAEDLNQIRANSTTVLQADLLQIANLDLFIKNAMKCYGQLDLLINNASTFYPTFIGKTTETQWNDLLGSNLKAPFFLSQAALPYLKQTHGNIINIIDIHAQIPMRSHTVYCVAKAGLAMMTKSLAKELGPEVRVNGISPGAIIWPEQEAELANNLKEKIISKTVLKRSGQPEDIAKTALFLAEQADYITGQIIAVDGGRGL